METSFHIFVVEEVDDELMSAVERLIPQLTANWPIPTQDFMAELVSQPATILLAARFPDVDGEIVAIGALIFIYAPSGVYARIEDVVVDEAARGQGIGRALTEEAMQLAREYGAKYLTLTSNPRREAANKLYQSLGFQRWDTNVYVIKCKDE